MPNDIKPSTICLNMIVKNESSVLKRNFDALRHYIDYWVIVDTGSTDGTQDLIRELLKDIPGELHERPWVNFGHNRNEALELAKGKADYLLMIDADETLEFSPQFQKTTLDADSYQILSKYPDDAAGSGYSYYRVQMVKDGLDWKWLGVLHEYVFCPEAKQSGYLSGVTNHIRMEGAHSREPDKYRKDAALLEEALLTEPDNARYVFYLAQSYRDHQEYGQALKNYEKRAAMGGWEEEVFYSLLQVACLQEILQMDSETCIRSYEKAFQFRPTRNESLYYLAQHYHARKHYLQGYALLKHCLSLPPSGDRLFLHTYIQDYGALYLLSECAFYLGFYDECQRVTATLLTLKLPATIQALAEKNMRILLDMKQTTLH